MEPIEANLPEPLSHCYTRTVRIETSTGSTASGFVMTYMKREWLVTAKHVVKSSGNQQVKALDLHGTELPGLKRLPEAVNHLDVAVYRFSTEHSEFGASLEPQTNPPLPSQDVFFLGFPGLGPGLVTAHPNVPFIKRAMVSGQAVDQEGTVVWLLDAVNSGGFSGGPLIASNENGKYSVFAVVSGYVPTELAVLGVPYLSASEEGGAGPRAFVKANSGLMFGFDISHATATIDQWLGSRPPE
ncbi:serine protease [Mycolicibacterium neoaurum]|uniref:S1 family peptidase n=1 Tax=Mycolicibacterium neoaurum TaxID=1795 RepID=UPI0026721EFD|nr:serine protease [Mycolicibacterium neoaurum]MDO3398675.1 serine protease [Mycolicibacterium neoaurum]